MTSPLGRLSFAAAPASAEPPAGQGEVDASLLRNKVEQRLEQVRSLPEIQSHILLALRERLGELAHDSWHTPQWIREREDAVVAEAVKALDKAEAAAAEALEEVVEQARKAATPKKGSTQDQILAALELQSAWTSVKQLLDGATGQADAVAAVEAACASAAADPTKLAALKTFGDDWVSATLAHEPRYAQERVRGLMHHAIDQAEAPNRTPLARAAHEILADAERGANRLQQNSQAARREIGWGGKAPAMASWADGEIIAHTFRGEFQPASIVAAGFSPRGRAWAIQAQKNYPLLTGSATDTPGGAAGIIQRMGGQLAE